jgi:hypothetical protein
MHLWQGVLSLCVGNRKKKKEQKAKKNKNRKATTRNPSIVSTDQAADC